MNQRPCTGVLAIAALAATTALAGGPVSGAHGAMPPVPRASDFSARVDNPWFPLKPGTTYTYRGEKDGQPSREVLTVTHRTRVIDGVPCVVIQDRLYLNGHLGERTTEWYSQDKQGNVWYFGENTAEFDVAGHMTTTSGTWRAGVKGARPGIFMFAHPRVGQSAQQEFFKGQAEDHFQVVSLHASASVPCVSSRRALLTKEWTPLEPGRIDHKLYVRGIATRLRASQPYGGYGSRLYVRSS
jgi:hypothetical protein